MSARILAPVDGCERSEEVLPYVEALSNRLGADVTLLHVFPPSLHSQHADHSRYVETLAAQLRDRLRHAGVQVEGVALEGKPNRAIADYASRDDISLIAASPHSQSSDGHWSVGRTADKVIRETSKPVLLVPTAGRVGAPGSGLMSRIVVPLDGSRESRAVLPHVESLLKYEASGDGGVAWLIHVIPAEHYAAGPVIAKRIPYTSDETNELRGQASRYLREVATKLQAGGTRIETMVGVGDAAAMIMRMAQDVDANLIAMTTHGYSGFSRLFLGSVAERVLHSSTIPLLLVKPLRY